MLCSDSESKNANGTNSNTLYISSPVSLSSRFLPESPRDVKHPTQVSMEAAILGVERHIYSILVYTYVTDIQITALRHTIPTYVLRLCYAKYFCCARIDFIGNEDVGRELHIDSVQHKIKSYGQNR
jgi:hypothetical protein